ncbi:MAG: 3D domain-containing protein [Candidatus Marinimicrobia bacterium]|nr:3D domain-containing protein [Candidatus Neomarinimicrobiota bacterium]
MNIQNKKIFIWRRISVIILLILLIPFSNACTVFQYQLRPPIVKPHKVETLQVTAYCACGECCGWEYNRFNKPVYSYGPRKGKRKIVGKTVSGIMAHAGTIAADTKLYPMGTIMYIKGYGYGTVEDRGSAIQGKHIDIFFKSHEQAMEWGNQTMEVTIWLPR